MADNRNSRAAIPPGARPDRLAGLSPSAVTLLQNVNTALARRDAPELQRRLAALVALAPSHPETLRMRAATAYLQGRNDEAVEFLRRVAAARPNDAQASFDLGNALVRKGDFEAAIATLRRAADLDPTKAVALLSLARTYEHQGDMDAAVAALEEAIVREPPHLPARDLLGRALHFAGRIAESEAAYRSALTLSPAAAMTWFGLSTLRTLRFGADDLAALEALRPETLREHERAPALFALAKAYEDNDRYADAFRTFEAANALRRRQLHWDSAVFTANVTAIEQTFGSRPGEVPADAGRGDGIVFLVGMPRSGSTLVEQILAAHPDVASGGELEDVRDLVRDESQRRGSDFPAWIDDTTDADWAGLARRYLDRTAHLRGSKPRFVDKALLNWRYVGALRAMLPGARFVDCRRDALETCLGCFRQLFETEMAFTYDLGELAAFWRDYDRLMRFWSARDPEAVFTLSHEKLVADPEAEIRRLLDFCGLPFDAACLRFHESRRAVRTASAAQVREPLRKNTARAERYGTLLDPLRAMLRT
ncbi:tetratricopeptide repeat-containing sulfotransferase family protein [Dokdonella sp.]|uniref:tetratricopeptide repeat-containing sulfotransferase family protein n=1 Tax=Dokdonella sp. TaxID=2291710 RepID=UPI001B045373|nr:tetratricopeptide repeat-containing sulfotransferase family protein [Dokdonella sp.]MBO9662502.1 tetratricopeptide repeat protein [Dokdonella sp.]